MAGEFPEFSRILIQERDEYMTVYMRTMLKVFTLRKLMRYQELKAQKTNGACFFLLSRCILGYGLGLGRI